MRVVIQGRSQSLSKKAVALALRFYARALVTRQVYKKLRITLRFTSKLVPSKAEMYPPTGNSYTIAASSRSGPYQLLENLAHEMIHVQQYLTGMLTEESMGTAWKGRIYKGDFHKDNEAYFNAPWEIDANGRTYWLYKCGRLFLRERGFKLRG